MKTSMIFGLIAGTALLLGSIGVASAQGPNYGRSPAALEGTWDVEITSFNCKTGAVAPFFRSRLMFNAGGTMMESPFNPRFKAGQRNPGLGFWERTGNTTYYAVFEAYIVETTANYTRGVQRVVQTIEMQDQDTWMSSAEVSFVDESGSPVSAGCMRAIGTRAY